MRDVYMIQISVLGFDSVYVEHIDKFREKGGFKDSWGVNWIPVVATNEEHAHEKGMDLLRTKRINKEHPASRY